ncbi:hypothetical protein BZA05DRAFT_473414 [Tricharina praecox]|uniref:uncharacterized protein n=1 Tax=Tricharina praecox TaxID=43433 RepID=UPI002220357A|nr:uncharacterized protein BZA05DRAFT_473414 [Tricharina praecox]KAI5853334.1 hypothetical protein BZA05DRAFT_473414 [Tricharina praecox]
MMPGPAAAVQGGQMGLSQPANPAAQRPGVPMQQPMTLKPEQIMVLDSKEVDPAILGPVSRQIPPQFKKWGELKQWAQQNMPELLETINAKQLRWAYQQKMQALQALRLRGLAAGAQPGGPPGPGVGPGALPIKSPLASLPPQLAQQVANMTDLQIQQMHKQNAAGGLNPQQQQILQIAIQYMRFRHLRTQQMQQQQALAAAAASRPPSAPVSPAETAPMQVPKPPVAAPAQPLQKRQTASPTLSKKVKVEPEEPKMVQRPPSQAEVARPTQVPHNLAHFTQSNASAVKPKQEPTVQQPPPPPPQNAPAQASQRPPVDLTQQSQIVFEQLIYMSKEEQKNPPVRPVVEMPPQEKEELRNNLILNATKMLIKRTDHLLPMCLLLGGDATNARELMRAKNLLASQYVLPSGEVKENLTIGLQEYHHCYRFLLKYFNMVKAEMSKMNQIDPEKAKAFTAAIHQLTQRTAPRAPGAPGAPVPPEAAAAAATAPSQQQTALNANNLQRHAEQLAEQHRLAQKAGRMSPDGSPPIVIKPSLTVDDLRLPNNRKRKSNDQPENASPSKIRSPKPATPQVTASPQPKARPPPPAEKKFKCDRPGCTGAFTLGNELAEHHKMHERDAERRRLEGERAKFKIENPLEYTLSSVAGALHLNRDGTMKASPAPGGLTPRPSASSTPQIKAGSSPLPPGSTPLRNAMTPKAKSPSQSKVSLPVRTASGSKPVAPDGEQVPTPPTTFWDTAGSPMALHQCFEGIEDISPLSKLDSSLFTPAYTPEDTTGDEKPPTMSNYEDWDPFGMKDVCGSEILQEVVWDTGGMESSVCSVKEGASWGEASGFMMFVQ